MLDVTGMRAELIQTIGYELASNIIQFLSRLTPLLLVRTHICNIEERVLHHKGTSVNERPRVSQKREDDTNAKTGAK